MRASFSLQAVLVLLCAAAVASPTAILRKGIIAKAASTSQPSEFYLTDDSNDYVQIYGSSVVINASGGKQAFYLNGTQVYLSDGVRILAPPNANGGDLTVESGATSDLKCKMKGKMAKLHLHCNATRGENTFAYNAGALTFGTKKAVQGVGGVVLKLYIEDV